MVAAMFNRSVIVELLLAHGADIHARSENGATAMEAARAMGAPDALALLTARLS